MASYWRAFSLAGVVSLIFGIVAYIQFIPEPSPFFMLPPYIPAVISAVFTLGCATTIQAVWYLIRRKKGTAGWLLITAVALPALYLICAVAASIFAIVTHVAGFPQGDLGIWASYMIIPAIWIASGIWLIRLDRRQSLADGALALETGSNESGKWPPLPG